MPSGRHRHMQPLHRMLPPLTVAGSAAALAVASLCTADTAVLRVLTLATAASAVTGAAVARTWDRAAGRRVAELNAARVRDEWHADERLAEAETDLEESREIRGRLEKKLRGKRAELARLRTEHADLLRRYATAESERARALESYRKLRLEGGQQQLALTTGPSPVGPAAFLKAAHALRDLPRNAARQQAQRTVEEARRREAAAADEPQGRHASGAPAPLPVREQGSGLVPAVAAAVLPYAQRSASGQTPAGHSGHSRATGGFDFFGTQRAGAKPADGSDAAPQGSAAEESAAEGVGVEESAAEVIDLTAHDDTEQFDVTELRATKA
ncbi:hypothetical protein VSR01_15185 [Actinacidiphila sp. DG2A-62]|uniref:hypothetical protein n=1 Tax=Actinacidiphila sp. DG2A-62 TaxID=3108821 RepID=UPI002DB8C54C|nr:hypothetical protein [Actinacidiphila sp. DG2A-62]MEC3994795.1 hypothetical protein [Actinacidiphila sp. DG2A-62]